MNEINNGLTVVSTGPKNELQVIVDNLRNRLPLIIEHQELIAKVRHASYLSHIKAGFTEPQALELCKLA